MALLEQALAKAGYVVSSWNAVSSIVTYEKITPRAAAAQLGAQVLFQVNSLERSETDPARDLRWERRFFESNQKGERLGDAFVSEERAQTLERGMNHGERSLIPETIMSATVNASVVDVKTGETIWFYEWTQAEVIKQDNTVQQLFVCNRKRENLCFLRTPAGQARKHTSAERSGGVSAISTKSGDQDARVAIYHELVRTVVEDLVNRFKVGHA